MKTTAELLGARIKELRKAKKLTQEQLSEKIGIDAKHLSRIEVGTSTPSLKTLERIAKSLNVEIKDLFEFMHLETSKKVGEDIQKLLKEADDKKLLLIQKIIRTLVR